MITKRIITGDALEQLRLLPEGLARCCVTSPPYFGLRDYGADGQIGLEDTPAEYVARLVEVFRQVRRALAKDGTLWLNLGDSYAGSWGAQGHEANPGLNGKKAIAARQVAAAAKKGRRTGAVPGAGGQAGGARNRDGVRCPAGLKPKDLMGIPWRVAFALQADGWYLRSDVIWSKPNPMPESTKDRPTKAHEYVFLFAKSPRYFYDAAAIAEPYAEGSRERMEAGYRDRYADGAVDVRGYRGALGGEGGMTPSATGMRNARTVWTLPTQPFHGAHFATMPPELARRCVLAGSAPGDVVLDPFNGAGTTGLAALELGRSYVGIEINPKHVATALARLEGLDAQFAFLEAP